MKKSDFKPVVTSNMNTVFQKTEPEYQEYFRCSCGEIVSVPTYSSTDINLTGDDAIWCPKCGAKWELMK